MSDTVKLIIEIPKETKQIFDKTESSNLGVVGRAVQNGTSLDDVKEQIRAKEIAETDIARQYYNLALGDAINILDYIGRK